jgi:hypothetical protein
LFKEIIADAKSINTLCGQNVELLIVKAGGEYSYHWLLKEWKIRFLTSRTETWK